MGEDPDAEKLQGAITVTDAFWINSLFIWVPPGFPPTLPNEAQV